MTVKRKKKSTFLGGRGVAVAFSLCLLAVITMIGMYTVGRTDEKQQELKRQIAEAEKGKSTEEEILKPKKEEPKETQEAASASATREKEKKEKEKTIINSPELESNFREEEVAEIVPEEELEEASVADVVMEQPALSFSPEEDKLFWPISGNILMDYSMDKSVYFTTLDQYKYNPAIIIEGSVDESVMCGAQGLVKKIETIEETGTTLTLDIGDGYELIYGQLKELPVKEGDYVKAGDTIGYVSEPTKYYSKEGTNVYLEIRKDGENVDPMLLLQ
ncbi:MAG: M23 family metallopeptidase [Lachnospiraceae bacterium]|nr:M23 family metallopeptidase [Lachnospiraceae bacterium]